MHARRLRRVLHAGGDNRQFTGYTAEQMPDLQNRGAVNNREMKRTECLFAKIRGRGRSVPLYAACRVWRCDRYMDGIMGEKKGEKRENRGKKWELFANDHFCSERRAMVSGKIDRWFDRVVACIISESFWNCGPMCLFEIFGRGMSGMFNVFPCL